MKIEFTKEKPRCETCLFATKMLTDGHFLCKKGKGVVMHDYACRRFQVNVVAMGNKRRHLHNLSRIKSPAAIV